MKVIIMTSSFDKNNLGKEPFALEREVSAADVEDNINNDDTDSQEVLCTNPYCKYPYHKNKGPPPPPPPQTHDRHAEFLMGHPPTFSHTSDPLKADD